jgi:Amidohydrolase family
MHSPAAFATGKNTVYQSALPLRGETDYANRRTEFDAGAAFIYHLARGPRSPSGRRVRQGARRAAPGPALLRDPLHRTRIGQLRRMGAARAQRRWARPGLGDLVAVLQPLAVPPHDRRARGARRRAADLPRGRLVPVGLQNLLGELKVADLWNHTQLGDAFSAQELCEMATCNPADALGWGDHVGRLRSGLRADVLVTSDRGGDVYRNLIEATERHVQLVTINGYPFYGTSALMQATGAPETESIRVAGDDRTIRLRYTGIPDADMGWADVLADLADATRDPVARYLALEKAHGDPDPQKRPVWLITDKPWDDPTNTGKPVPVTVRIPPLDSLEHDAAYFAAVAAGTIADGKLDGLAAYYRL